MLYEPPTDPVGPLMFRRLPADWRGYRISVEPFRADQFNFTKADNPFRGGRFDSASGEYGYLYIGSTLAAAVAETLIRDMEFPADGTPRVLVRKEFANKFYASITLGTEVRLVDMTDEPRLARLGQSNWLVHSKSRDYPHTRAWADRIREWAPDAHGFIWRPRHLLGQRSVVLFDDRAGTRPSARHHLIPGPEQSLESGRGLAVLKRTLLKFSVVLGP